MPELSLDSMRILREVLQDFPDAKLLTEYSGRAMFGRRCLAISGQFDTLALGIAIGTCGTTELAEVLSAYKSSQDSMGLGKVVYWSWVSCPTEDPKVVVGKKYLVGDSKVPATCVEATTTSATFRDGDVEIVVCMDEDEGWFDRDYDELVEVVEWREN